MAEAGPLGGLAQRIDILREIILARFQTEHRLCPTPDDTLGGLLALAVAFGGRADSVQEAIGLLTQRQAQGK